MSGKKTSVYLPDEIATELERRHMTVMQAIRAGLEHTSIERQALRRLLDLTIEIHGAVTGSIETQRRQVGTSLAGTTGADDTWPQQTAGRAHCKRCLHEIHGGDCASGCPQCRAEDRIELRYSRNTGPAPLDLPSGTANCTSQCDHAAGRHVPKTPHQRGLLTGTMTPEDTAGISEPAEFYPERYTETSPAIFHSPPQEWCDQRHDCNLACSHGCTAAVADANCPRHGEQDER